MSNFMITYNKVISIFVVIKGVLTVEKFRFLKQKMKNTQESVSFLTIFDHSSTVKGNTFNALYDNHPDVVFTLDINGDIIDYNKSIKQILGYNDKELIGNLARFLDRKDQHKRRKHLQQALEGKAQNFQAVIFHKNGKPIDVDVTYIPIFDKNKQVSGIYGITKDITYYVQSRKELTNVKNSLELAQQMAKLGSWEYDITENVSYWSKQKSQIYGLENSNDFVPTLEKVIEYVHPQDREYFEHTLIDAINDRKSFIMEFRILRKDGTVGYVIEQADVILNENGEPIRFIGTSQDITKRKMAEINLFESEQRFKNIYNNLEVGIWSFDFQTKTYLLRSPGIKEITGYSSNEFDDVNAIISIIHPEDLPRYTELRQEILRGKPLYHHYRIIHKNGEVRWVQDQSIPVFDSNGNIIRVDGIITNITEHKKSEEIIKHLAYHDYLTDLPNRRMFDEKVKTLIESSTTNKKTFAILYMDLDRFKPINDTLGNGIADQLLKQFTQRIDKILNNSSLFARLGSDEFGVILWDIPQSDYPVNVAKAFIDKLRNPFFIEDYELFITSSIGISTFPTDGETSEELLRNADAALYRAKENGKNNYQIYSSSLNIKSYKLFTLERDLRRAIENNEFLVYFQPRVEANTGKMVSAEALIRWEHPVWGLISPKEFIPLAEENGFIIEIGDWVLKQVCHYIKEWELSGLPIVPISINQSAKRFLRNDWTTTVFNVLKETNIDPSLIEFEITETTLLQHNETVKSSIDFLKDVGIKVALDDFGTGYSSLTHLERYPIDTLKIDQSFIRNISNHRDEMIIKSTIFLAKGLNIRVVAEGVETMEQLSFLQQQQCDEIQGYLFSRPVSKKEFQDLLKKVIFKPTGTVHNSDEIINRRIFYRINLMFPMSSQMSLTSIKGQKVELGKTEVLIQDIGFGGIKFLSTLDLPIRPDIVLQFETKIMGQEVTLIGIIVWKQEVKDLFQYGLQFIIDERERDELVGLLNNFTIKLRKNPLVPDCNFIQEDELTYLKKS
jgi:diguanylate cyclase (GGDEF)-like protein/PAS domain S-box-containing protein